MQPFTSALTTICIAAVEVFPAQSHSKPLMMDTLSGHSKGVVVHGQSWIFVSFYLRRNIKSAEQPYKETGQ